MVTTTTLNRNGSVLRGERNGAKSREQKQNTHAHEFIIRGVESALPVAMKPTRLWLWPNLLSLDAPIVAVLWQILFARCFQVPVDGLAALLLLLTVWLIYSADRTLDAWKGDCHSPRHEFYRRWWRQLFPLWMSVLGLTGWLAAEHLSSGLFLRGVILLAAIGVYFALVHSGILRGPKEAAVGVLFALGASLEAWSKVASPADVATILLFSGLCWMNCIAIQRWATNPAFLLPSAGWRCSS